MNGQKVLQSIGSGAIGAATLTLLHESARRVQPKAPRMDILGMRSLSKMMRAVGLKPPGRRRLHRTALLGDLASNGVFYSLVGAGRGPGVWMRGGLLGLAAGLGGVFLPERLHLGSWPSARTPETKWMTVAWYVTGGLAAAAASTAFSRMRRESTDQNE